MTSDFIVRGDHLPVLHQLAVAQASGPESPRALVWGVDLRNESTRRGAQKQLRRVCREIAAFTATRPGLAHLYIAYSHGGSLPEASCLSAAAQVAQRVHAELERSLGTDIDVVLLDVTGWEDGGMLRDRILEAVVAPAGSTGDAALGWHEILSTSIRRAASSQLY